jgi:hypothetical protein
MKVGFTGSRHGMSLIQQDVLMVQLHQLGVTELHHGDCRGSDEQADSIAKLLGIMRVAHPPTGSGLRAYCTAEVILAVAPFLQRNHDIVQDTQLLIAAPDRGEFLRSGTWATVRYARRLSLPIMIILPDGAFTTPLTGSIPQLPAGVLLKE